jgi:hypothetical protein
VFSQALRNPSRPIDLTGQNPGSAQHLKKEAIPTEVNPFGLTKKESASLAK